MGSRLHGGVLVRHCGRQAFIPVSSSCRWSETSIGRNCPQLELRLPELRGYREKGSVPPLQGQVVDNLRLIWEKDPKTQDTRMFAPFREVRAEYFLFGFRLREDQSACRTEVPIEFQR